MKRTGTLSACCLSLCFVLCLATLAMAEKPKPVEVTNTVPVTGDVNVVNTPGVVITNTQAAPLPVTVEGTASQVTIINDAATPVQIQAGAARIQFYSATGFVLIGTEEIDANLTGADPGYLLVVEQVGIQINRADEGVQTTGWSLGIFDGTRSWTYPLLFPQPGAPNFLQGSQSIRLYHNMNQPMTFRYARTPIGPRVELTVIVTGYTIPVGDPRLGP